VHITHTMNNKIYIILITTRVETLVTGRIKERPIENSVIKIPHMK